MTYLPVRFAKAGNCLLMVCCFPTNGLLKAPPPENELGELWHAQHTKQMYLRCHV